MNKCDGKLARIIIPPKYKINQTGIRIYFINVTLLLFEGYLVFSKRVSCDV